MLSQIVFRINVSLFGGELPPSGRFVGVSYDAPSEGKAHTQVVLGFGYSLCCRQLPPLDGLPVILRDAPPQVVAEADIKLCSCKTVFSGSSIPLYRFCVGLCNAVASCIENAQFILGVGI